MLLLELIELLLFFLVPVLFSRLGAGLLLDFIFWQQKPVCMLRLNHEICVIFSKISAICSDLPTKTPF